jgi:hypothetical protein
MERIVRHLASAALVLAGGASGWAADVRLVAIAPPPSLDGRPSPATVFAAALAQWLPLALAEIPGITVVPAERSARLFESMTSGAWLEADEDLGRSFRRYEPAAVLVTARPRASGVDVTVWSEEGPAPLFLEAPTKERFRDTLIQAAEFLAHRLGLSPEQRMPLMAVPPLDGESLALLFSASLTSVAWPRNSGESRLKTLQPVWNRYPTDPHVCAEMLRAVAVQLASRRRDQSYTPTAIQIGRMAIPPVLGTPLDEAVLHLLRLDPDTFLPEVEKAAAPLRAQACDGLLGAALEDMLGENDGENGRRAESGGVWASGRYRRAQQLGAVRLLARLGGESPRRLLAVLADHPDPEVRQAASPPPAPDTSASLSALSREEWMRRAQDPEEAVAGEARRHLAAYEPKEFWAQTAFRLSIAHPRTRETILAGLATNAEPRALTLLAETAADNPDPHTRAQALDALAAREADRACALAVQALMRRPGHRLERLQAAAVLLRLAGPAMADDLARLILAEPDRSVRMYLEAARAKAEGHPAPTFGAPARKVGGARNLTWLCGPGADAPNSPFDAYYCLSMPTDSNLWQRAYQAGKIFFVRLTPVNHPGLVTLNRTWRDRFWLALEAELTPERLALLDGIVLGEETMTLAPEGLWEEGWRLFCEEAGVDPDRIRGDPAALTPSEAGQWRAWAYERSLDGFNRIVAFVRLRYPLERPGLQIGTFLPGEMGTTGPGIRRWQFDVAGIYDYKCDQRMAAVSLVRRLKTLWPDRPVIWLSLGIGGYEMNPVWYTHQPLERPLATRHIRAYADTVAAWLAGADTGWFSTWIFVAPRFQKGMSLAGVQVNLEEIAPQSPVLERALQYAFRGAEEFEELKHLAAPHPREEPPSFESEGKETCLVADLAKDMEKRDEGAGDQRRILEQRREAIRRGFQFYRQYLYECARVFRSLPRLAEEGPAALVVHPGVSVWTTPPTRNPLVPGHALLNVFDFADDERQMAEPGADLSRYHLLLVHQPGPWSNAVGEAVIQWLRAQEGVLYLHQPGEMPMMPWSGEVECRRRDRPGGPTPTAMTLEDESGGRLDVAGAIVGTTFTLRGSRVRAVLRRNGDPVLAVWRDPAVFRGVVLFDGIESATREYLEALRHVLVAEGGEPVARQVRGPILHSVRRGEGWTAAACSGYHSAVSDRVSYPGVDLLTGEPNPRVGGGLSAVLTAERFDGLHLRLEDGVLFLSEFPMRPGELRRTETGWVWTGPGLLRITRVGALRVEPCGEGEPLPAIPEEEVADWLAAEDRPGLVCLPASTTDGVSRIYLRSNIPLLLQPQESHTP